MIVPLALALTLQAQAAPGCAFAPNPSARAECEGDAATKAAQNAAKGSDDQLRLWRFASERYREAVDRARDDTTRGRLLQLLADLLDRNRLNVPNELDQTLRELIRYSGTDLKPTFRLARLEEDQGALDEAEIILLEARRLQPDQIEPYRMLAQFYARRATAMQQATRAKETDIKQPQPPATPDASGVYQVGDGVTAPRRVGNATYPPEAQVAGISGNVTIEITLNEQGLVADANVIRSVPFLDEAALKAVREWRYDPVLVNGKPVPARMTVTVNFTLPSR
jgi:TonB family protein